VVKGVGSQQCVDEAVVDMGDRWESSVHWAFPGPASLVVPMPPC
jgi:hypothetical protein